MAIGSIMMIAGAAAGAAGSLMSGIQARRIADMNAELARRDAESAKIRGEINADAAHAQADRIRRQGRRAKGRAVSAISGSGIQLSGTPTDVLADMAGEIELEAQLADHDAELARFEARERAASSIGEAQIIKAKGRNAQRRGFFAALTGFAQAGKSASDAGMFSRGSTAAGAASDRVSKLGGGSVFQ